MDSVAEFLGRPIAARVALSGPQICPVWFLWHTDAFWWLLEKDSSGHQALKSDVNAAIVVDTCDVQTGEMLQVYADGPAQVLPMSWEIGFRVLAKYLGADSALWPHERFLDLLYDEHTRLVRLPPRSDLELVNLSFQTISPPSRAIDLAGRPPSRNARG